MTKNAKVGSSGFFQMNLCLDIKQNKLIADQWGEMHCSSRFKDMLCDAQSQYGDYSELDMCPMWGMCVKEGGDKDPTKMRRGWW